MSKSVVMFLAILVLLCGCEKKSSSGYKDSQSESLVIYLLDSALSKELLEKTVNLFAQRNSCQIGIEVFSDTNSMVEKLIQAREEPEASLVIGLDNTFLPFVSHEDILVSYKSENLNQVSTEFHFDRSYLLTPYDYSYYAFIYDSQAITNPPLTFGNMQDGKWKNHMIIPDPRTSNDGLGMLVWSVSAFGENGFGHFWRSIKNNVLSISSSMDEAYSMFLSGEAPIVFSYTTTEAFHWVLESSSRYKALIPLEGGFIHFNAVGVVKDSPNLDLAKKFVDYMLTRDFQKDIPTLEWMYPVNDQISLPPYFAQLPVPETILNGEVKNLLTRRRVDNWVQKWIEIMVE